MSELIYGRRAVLETLRAARRRIYRLWFEGDSSTRRNSNNSKGILAQIRNSAEVAGISIRTVKDGPFERLASQNANAQSVALEVGEYPYVDIDQCLQLAQNRQQSPFLLILDHLQDPQNLGTLIRSADAMGIHGLVIPDRRSARITPAVTNASAGAVEHLLIAQVTNLNRLIDTLKSANIWVGGLDNDESSPFLGEIPLTGALAIVVGNENTGLSRLTREKCDFLIRLPMYGQIESLNAAVAGSIVLYTAQQARQRG